MVKHIKTMNGKRVVTPQNIHRADAGANMYLLRYTDLSTPCLICWVPPGTSEIKSNIRTECMSIPQDTSDYLLVSFLEIKHHHDSGRTVDPHRIPEVIRQYLEERKGTHHKELYVGGKDENDT